MNDELKNILKSLNDDIDQEKLLHYINGKLPEQEQQDMEQQLRADPFLADAVEGLNQISSKEKAELLAYQINKSLKDKLQKPKQSRNRNFWNNDTILYTSIGILLLVAVIGYLIIRKYWVKINYRG